MDEYDTRDSRDDVLRAGYELHRHQGYEAFSGAMISHFLNQEGTQDLPTASIRRACEYLLEHGLFTEGNYGTSLSITASGINRVEGHRER